MEKKTTKEIENEKPSQNFKYEGVQVEVYGQWDAEKIVKRLMQSDSITS